MADIHKVYLSSLFLAYLFQFQNPTLLSSPLLSLLIGSVLARYFQVAAPSHQICCDECRFPPLNNILRALAFGIYSGVTGKLDMLVIIDHAVGMFMGTCAISAAFYSFMSHQSDRAVGRIIGEGFYQICVGVFF